jgi:hypothetical protein
MPFAAPRLWAEQIGALAFLLDAVPDMPDQAIATGRENSP